MLPWNAGWRTSTRIASAGNQRAAASTPVRSVRPPQKSSVRPRSVGDVALRLPEPLRHVDGAETERRGDRAPGVALARAVGRCHVGEQEAELAVSLDDVPALGRIGQAREIGVRLRHQADDAAPARLDGVRERDPLGDRRAGVDGRGGLAAEVGAAPEAPAGAGRATSGRGRGWACGDHASRPPWTPAWARSAGPWGMGPLAAPSRRRITPRRWARRCRRPSTTSGLFSKTALPRSCCQDRHEALLRLALRRGRAPARSPARAARASPDPARTPRPCGRPRGRRARPCWRRSPRRAPASAARVERALLDERRHLVDQVRGRAGDLVRRVVEGRGVLRVRRRGRRAPRPRSTPHSSYALRELLLGGDARLEHVHLHARVEVGRAVAARLDRAEDGARVLAR